MASTLLSANHQINSPLGSSTKWIIFFMLDEVLGKKKDLADSLPVSVGPNLTALSRSYSTLLSIPNQKTSKPGACYSICASHNTGKWLLDLHMFMSGSHIKSKPK